MLRFLFIACLPLVLAASERWVAVRSGPFEVLSAAGERPAREALNELEQLRRAFEEVLGQRELHSVWPVRLLIFPSSNEMTKYPASSLRMARDTWIGGVVKGDALPLRDCARILLEDNAGRMAEPIERGLLDVFSTVQVDATRITLGAPLPASRRDKDWARMHLLTVSPVYSGRVRVLFSNLQQGADWRAAYGNAFQMTPEEIDAETDRYLATGSFPTRRISGAPINLRRDFRVRDVEPASARTALADLLEGHAAAAAYQAILNEYGATAEALEGLGLFAEAVEAGSQSARCHLEFGRLQKDPAKTRAAFEKAAELNSLWAEPHFRIAELEPNLALKARHLKTAADLEPRNAVYWQLLAETRLATNNFDEAARAWTGAERAAASENERERFRQARQAVEKQRTDYIEAERRRVAEARERELERLREAMMAKIRAAEEEASRDAPPISPDEKIVEWWDDPRPSGKLRGVLQQVDCIQGVVRLVVQAEGSEPARLLIRDPSQVVVLGAEDQTLGCGPQRPPRKVVVEYVKTADTKLATVGEVTVIEFQ